MFGFSAWEGTPADGVHETYAEGAHFWLLSFASFLQLC